MQCAICSFSAAFIFYCVLCTDLCVMHTRIFIRYLYLALLIVFCLSLSLTLPWAYAFARVAQWRKQKKKKFANFNSRNKQMQNDTIAISGDLAWFAFLLHHFTCENNRSSESSFYSSIGTGLFVIIHWFADWLAWKINWFNLTISLIDVEFKNVSDENY